MKCNLSKKKVAFVSVISLLVFSIATFSAITFASFSYSTLLTQQAGSKGRQPKNIYLNPGPWNTDGAKFYMLAFENGNNSNQEWSSSIRTTNEGYSVFQFKEDKNYNTILFVRMKADTDGPSFTAGEMLNQTDDISYDEDYNLYTITRMNNTNGIYISDNSSPHNIGTYSLGDSTAPENKLSFYFTNNWGWSNVYFYVWEGAGGDGHENATYPGEQINSVFKYNEYGQPVYRASFDTKYENLIFNNGTDGNANKTVDIDLTDFKISPYTRSTKS